MVKKRLRHWLIVCTILAWLSVAGAGILLTRAQPWTLTEMLAYSLAGPILAAAFFYGRPGGLVVALLASLLSGSLAVGQPEALESPIVQRVLFQIIFFNAVALMIGSLAERQRATRKQLEIIQDSAIVGSVLIEAETHKIVEINRYAAEMIGLTREQIIGCLCFEFLCPNCKGMCPILDLKQPLDDSERVLMRADGTRVPIHKTVTPITIGDQKHLIETFLDLSERVKAEEELSRSETLFRAITQQTGEGISLADAAGNYILVNVAFCQMTGYSEAELLAMTVSDLVPRETEISLFPKIVKGETGRRDTKLVRKDGSFFDAEISGYPIRLGNHPLVLGIIRDVTRRKHAEAALVEREAFYRALLENSAEGVGILDAGGIMRYLAPAEERLTGYDPQDTIGKSAFENMQPEDVPRLQDTLQKSLEQPGAIMTLEYRLQRADEMWRHYEATAHNLLHNPVINGIVVNYRDITERKQAEEQLLRRDALLEAVAYTAERFLKTTTWQEEAPAVLGKIGAAVGAGRIFIFENHRSPEGELLASLRFEWVIKEVFAQIENPKLQGIPYLAGGFRRWVEFLGEGKIIHGPVRDFPRSERRALRPLRIRSVLLLPVAVESKWWGFIGFGECLSERVWDVTEIELLKTVADILGDAIRNQRAQQRIGRLAKYNQNIVSSAPVGIVTVDSGGQVTNANEAFLRMMGSPGLEETLELGMNIPSVRSAGLSAAFQKTLTDGVSFDFKKMPYSSHWGAELTVNVKGVPQIAEDGKIAGVILVVEDVTDTVKAEKELLKNLQQRSTLYTLLHIAMQEIPLADKLEHTLDELFSLPWLRLTSKGGVFLREADSEILKLKAQRNLPDELRTMCAQVPFGHCLCGRAAATGEIQFADCLDERHDNRYAGLAPHGHYNIPIISQQRIIGVMVLYLLEGHWQTQEELEFLEAVANTLAVMIERARVEDERLARLAELEKMEQVDRVVRESQSLSEMMRAALDDTLDILECDRAWLISPVDPEATAWQVPMASARPEWEGAFDLGTDIPINVDEAVCIQTALASEIPVILTAETEPPLPQIAMEKFSAKSIMLMALHPKTGQPWIFGVHQCTHARQWTDSEQRIFSEISRRLTDGLTSMLYLRDLQNSEQFTRSLYRLAGRLEMVSTYPALLAALNEEIQDVTGYQSAWIYLMFEDRKNAELMTFQGEKLSEIHVQYPVLEIAGDAMLEEIASGQGVVLVEDARTDPRTNKEIVAQLDNRTIINIPIKLYFPVSG